MSFLAPGEINRVWVLQYIDYDDFEVIGIYTSELAADTAKHDLEQREISGRLIKRNLLEIDEVELDSDLKDHYWWEPRIEIK